MDDIIKVAPIKKVGPRQENDLPNNESDSTVPAITAHLPPQQAQMVDIFKTTEGAVTTLEFRAQWIMSPAARGMELRAKGYQIDSIKKKIGRGRVSSYTLISEPVREGQA